MIDFFAFGIITKTNYLSKMDAQRRMTCSFSFDFSQLNDTHRLLHQKRQYCFAQFQFGAHIVIGAGTSRTQSLHWLYVVVSGVREAESNAVAHYGIKGMRHFFLCLASSRCLCMSESGKAHLRVDVVIKLIHCRSIV